MLATGVDIDGEPWLDPPCMGADQYVAGEAAGVLTATIEAGYTNVATEFPVSFTGKIAGGTTASAWDFGDGTVVSNRPYATHAWSRPGSFQVRLTAYNDSFPGGVSATLAIEVSAISYYVDPSSAAPVYPYTNWATAARTIQEAVEAGSVPGRLILVTNGVYRSGSMTVAGMQNRVALTAPAVLASVNGPSLTRIEGAEASAGGNGDGAIRCAYVGAGAVLSGFTLTNGHTRAYAAGLGSELLSGGGVWCEYGGLVTNCVFVGNTADNVGGGGGGAYGGTLESCVLSGGSAYSGGGACGSTLLGCTVTGNKAMEGGGVAGGSLTNCTLSENHADHRGGGANGGLLKDCIVAGNSAVEGGGVFAATLYNCTVTNNSAVDSSGGAGGGTLYNSIVSGNSAYQGGGGSGCVLYNCTVTRNSAYRGGGVSWAVRLYNCIVYYNEALLGANYEPEGVDFNFSCTTPLPAGGKGNIAEEPQLASLTHLSAASPCIGMGNAEYVSGLDVDGEPWLNPPCMGADQYVAGDATGALTVAIGGSQAHIASGSPLALTAKIDGPATASEWDFGDGTLVWNRPCVQHAWVTPGLYTLRLTAYNDSFPGGVSATALVQVSELQIHYVDQANATPLFPYTNWSDAAQTIQDAVGAALQGDTVLVTNGVYASGGWAASGTLTNRIAVLRPLRLASVNGPSVTVIQGIAANGADGNGDSAIRCVYLCGGAVLSGFTLTNGHTRAYAPGLGPDLLGGGGVWCEPSAVVTNCVITGSTAAGFGGGAYGGIFYRSKFSGNNVYVIGLGGGVFRGWLYDCELTGNGWSVYGGGAYESTLYNCSLSGNSASGGGGAFLTTLYNCVLSRNVAGYGGGTSSSVLYNCTVTGNSADQSGGVESSEIYNCIVYYNTAPVGANCSGSGTAVANSCTTPLPALGNGNITNEPSFLDQPAGNLRLSPDSPCINAGCNAFAFTDSDADGNPRIRGGTVDMGAYEFQTPSTVISVAWLQYYGLPIDGSADYADPDHDGMNNWQEWRAGTDPTNAISVLRLVSASAALPGVTLTWESVSNRSYFLERSGNLVPPVFVPVATNIAGQAGVTSYTDDTITGSGPFFYRVGVE
jgi:PKD repeat protein